jgi:hypothetical protein
MEQENIKKRVLNIIQDDIVKRTLEEEEAAKRAKKAGKQGTVPPKKKGLTLQEIEVNQYFACTWISMIGTACSCIKVIYFVPAPPLYAYVKFSELCC